MNDRQPEGSPPEPATPPDVGAIVLAGGRSERFGRDKLSEAIDGRPLLWHAIDAVRQVAGEYVVVVAPDAHPDLPDDVLVAHDPVAFEGPLAGLSAGLTATRADTVIVVGGDMPSVVGSVALEMLASLADPAFDAVVLEHDGRARPLPLVVRRDPARLAARRLLDRGERRLRALTTALATSVIPEATWRRLDPDGRSVRDVDTPDDLPPPGG
jgi:molybdopterin-guanine dinucleotide biosynthesis protein A